MEALRESIGNLVKEVRRVFVWGEHTTGCYHSLWSSTRGNSKSNPWLVLKLLPILQLFSLCQCRQHALCNPLALQVTNTMTEIKTSSVVFCLLSSGTMVGLTVHLLPGSALQTACWGFPFYFFPSSCQSTSGLLLGCICWLSWAVRVWHVEKVLWLLQFKLVAVGYCFLFICLAFWARDCFPVLWGTQHNDITTWCKHKQRFAESNWHSRGCKDLFLQVRWWIRKKSPAQVPKYESENLASRRWLSS